MKKLSEKESIVINSLIERNLMQKSGSIVISDSLLDSYVTEYARFFGNGNVGKQTNRVYARKLAGLTLLKVSKQRTEEYQKIKPVSISSTTKSGFVYLLSNKSFPGFIKIGMTRDLETRLKVYNTGDPHRGYQYELTKFSSDANSLEKILLEKYSEDINQGEWIKLQGRNISLIVEDVRKTLRCEPNGKAADC